MLFRSRKKTIFITGQQIISELEKILKIQVIPNFLNIRSSPYMRTIQTTTHMINGIKTKFINNNDISILNNIYIDYGLIERLKERKKYTKGYLNFLDNPNYANIDNELKNVVFIDKNENEFKIKTETAEECYERCKDYLFNFLKPIIINYENEKVKIFRKKILILMLEEVAIMISFHLLSLYYVLAFGNIYQNNQLSMFICFIFSIVFMFIYSVVICLFISIFQFLGNKWSHKLKVISDFIGELI